MFRQLEALRLDATERLAELTRRTGDAALDRLDALEDDPRYERVRERVAAQGERALPKVAAAKEALAQRRDKAAESDAGGSVGRATRTVMKTAQTLPLLSGTGDVIAVRHGLDLLVPMFKAAPRDPQVNLWMGEALQRSERDMHAIAAARAMVEPWSLATRYSVRFAAGLGQDAADGPASVRFLRRAFQLAAPAAKAGGCDPVALHVLARVYLARGVPADALRLAKLAAGGARGPQAADVLVTAAHAYKALAQHRNAADAARLAVERGSTLGYEILAAAGPGAEATTALARLSASGDQLQRIELSDRARYHGVARTPAQIAQIAARQQRAKASEASQKSKQLARDAAQSVRVAAEQQRAKLAASSEPPLAFFARQVLQAARKRGHDG